VIEDMLHGLGARLFPIEAPFDPEQGAYGQRHSRDHADDGHSHGDQRHHDHHGHDHNDG
jgi:urease accessory protein